MFDMSARAGWTLRSATTIAVEYFSRPGTTKHFAESAAPHHLLFSSFELAMSSNRELTVGAGHCLAGGEPWVFKSVVGVRLGRE